MQLTELEGMTNGINFWGTNKYAFGEGTKITVVLRDLTEQYLEYSHDRNCIFNTVCTAKIIINKALGFIVLLVLHWHPWLFEENLSTKRDHIPFFCHTIGFSVIPSIKSYGCSMLAQIPETGGMW